MLEQIRSQIEAEITGLMHELHVDLPERIKIAREHGDLRENSEFKAAKERQGFVEARLNHLTTRMTELSKIDVTDMAYDRVGKTSPSRSPLVTSSTSMPVKCH